MATSNNVAKVPQTILIMTGSVQSLSHFWFGLSGARFPQDITSARAHSDLILVGNPDGDYRLGGS
jgi:hypothetical protein